MWEGEPRHYRWGNICRSRSERTEDARAEVAEGGEQRCGGRIRHGRIRRVAVGDVLDAVEVAVK